MLELDGVQQRECCLLTEDRRIKLPSEWAQQLPLDAIKLQARDGVNVLGFVESAGPCSLRTFEEVCRLLGWDTNSVHEFGSEAHPVNMQGGVAGNRCQCQGRHRACSQHSHHDCHANGSSRRLGYPATATTAEPMGQLRAPHICPSTCFPLPLQESA